MTSICTRISSELLISAYGDCEDDLSDEARAHLKNCEKCHKKIDEYRTLLCRIDEDLISTSQSPDVTVHANIHAMALREAQKKPALQLVRKFYIPAVGIAAVCALVFSVSLLRPAPPLQSGEAKNSVVESGLSAFISSEFPAFDLTEWYDHDMQYLLSSVGSVASPKEHVKKLITPDEFGIRAFESKLENEDDYFDADLKKILLVL